MNILVGHGCQYHGGIRPTHMLTFRENSREMLFLRDLRRDTRSGEAQPDVVWITSRDRIVENALLLIALHVCDLPQLKGEAVRFVGLRPTPEIDLSRCGDSQELGALHELCRELFPPRCKLVITVCDQSAAREQLSVLRNYPMEVEVCTPEFQRLWNMWSNADDKMETLGDFYHGVLADLPQPLTGKASEDGSPSDLVVRRAHRVKRRKAVRPKQGNGN